MIRDRNIFITGGAGFIGSTVIGRLIEGNRIAVYDSFRRDSIHDRPYASHPNLRLVEGDVLDAAGLASQMAGADIVLHCAAIAGIDTVCRQPTATMRVNMLGTANALEAARQLPELERFVGFSTSEVFGQSAFRSEETDSTSIGAVGEARWTYAVSKLAGEFLTKAYHQEFGMPTVTVRPFNVYGPGQVGEGAMKVFITRALSNADITIHNEGNQIRAWCYIDDFVDGLLLTMSQPGAIGESFNIGNPRAVITVYGLAQTVVRVLRSSSRIVFAAGHHTDVELRVPSVAKAAELLGFQAKVDLEEGILATAEFFRKTIP